MKTRRDLTDDEVVEQRLRHFINKYYRVKIIQGLILTVSAGLMVLFGLVVLGNALDLNEALRNVLVIAGSLIWIGVLAWFILKPLAQRMGWIKGLNFKEASGIIQQKHKSVEDRIINIIELTREKAGQDNKLYDYAIAQKSDNIRNVNFNDAVSLRKAGIFIARLALLTGILAGVILLWPDFVKKGIGSMWAGNEQIAGLKRITITILNDSLEVESGRDFLLRFTVQSEFPVENVSVRIGSGERKADQVPDGYEYLFQAVNSPVNFRIVCNGVVSGEYVLKTLKKPEIAALQLKLIPPSYTGLESSVIDGDGDAEAPAGTRIVWSIRTVNADEVIIMDEMEFCFFKRKRKYLEF